MTSRPSPGMLRLSAALYLCAPLVLLAVEAIVAARFPGYSYVDNYVSDLGVPEIGAFEGRPIDSPLAWLMNTGFIVHGLLVLAATVTLVRAAGRGRLRWVLLVSAVVYAIGLATIAIVHGSEHSQAAGIVWVHFLGGGLLAFAGSAMAVAAGLGSRRYGVSVALRGVSVVLGVLSLALIVLLAVDKGDPAMHILGEGALERGALYSILLWQILIGATMIRERGMLRRVDRRQ
jgi:hypothetical membrane protein